MIDDGRLERFKEWWDHSGHRNKKKVSISIPHPDKEKRDKGRHLGESYITDMYSGKREGSEEFLEAICRHLRAPWEAIRDGGPAWEAVRAGWGGNPGVKLYLVPPTPQQPSEPPVILMVERDLLRAFLERAFRFQYRPEDNSAALAEKVLKILQETQSRG